MTSKAQKFSLRAILERLQQANDKGGLRSRDNGLMSKPQHVPTTDTARRTACKQEHSDDV